MPSVAGLVERADFSQVPKSCSGWLRKIILDTLHALKPFLFECCLTFHIATLEWGGDRNTR
jgi:hypothetical protein